MFEGVCGATLESPTRGEGWNEEMVEEADGESEVLLCEGGYLEEWRGLEMGDKRKKENKIVINVSFQSVWTVTVVQDLG